MALKIQIDAAKIAASFKEYALEIEQDLRKSMGDLAAITHAKILEMAQTELKSSRKDYTDNLGFEEIAPGVWVVSLEESALWIEDGIDANTDMKPGLLKNAKTGKNGTRYKVIPFRYDRPGSQNTPFTNNVINHIKQQLKEKKVSFKKIEYNEDGSPKVGKLHEFDFGNPGGRMGGPGKGNTPVAKGLSIYQSVTKSGNVRRDILTFRTVSSGPKSVDKWFHPGSPGKKYFEKAYDWALNEWQEKILPEVLNKWGK